MAGSTSSFLTAWSGFYTTTGSSAAALTGLMFVVITLVWGQRKATSHDGIATFSTPTVLHFSTALLASVILSAPWHDLLHPAALIGLLGLYGIVHIVRVIVRARRMNTYEPDLEDWICYTGLPILAYAAMFAGAVATRAIPETALFVIAGGVVILIFVGIRNSWDVVTYLAMDLGDDEPD